MEFKLQRVSYYLYPVSFFISNVTSEITFLHTITWLAASPNWKELDSRTPGPRVPCPALLRTPLWWDSGFSLTGPLRSLPWEPSHPPSTRWFTLHAKAPHHRHSCPDTPTKQFCPFPHPLPPWGESTSERTLSLTGHSSSPALSK